MDRMDDFTQKLAELDQRLGASADMVSAFDAELAGMGRNLVYTEREIEGLSRSLGFGLRRAFDGVVFDGQRLSDVLRGLGRSIADAAYSAAMRPVQGALGSVLAGLLPFAAGAGFAQGRVMPFAQGGVVSGATAFPMRGGIGLMGEAGPEAIMPLARGPDGRLGVRGGPGAGGRPVHVTFNISTPDVAGFQRSQSQIAAQMNRLLAQGQRNR